VREIKGLDMVRRDWCGLAKEVGSFALGKILSGQPCEEVVEAIHQHLREVWPQVKGLFLQDSYRIMV
jgi:DNA polymerase alpha subunit A